MGLAVVSRGLERDLRRALPVCARAYDAAVRAWFEARPAGPLELIRLCLRDEPVIEAVLAELGLRP